jgi:hypothetical protein
MRLGHFGHNRSAQDTIEKSSYLLQTHHKCALEKISPKSQYNKPIAPGNRTD